jgi:hypothetical protein
MSAVQAELRSLEVTWPLLVPNDRALKLAHILAHLVGRFIQIHPFLDGNGRTSRLVWAWGLLRFGLPIQARIAPRPGFPYSVIMQSCMQGDFAPLTLHVLHHLAAVKAPQQV